MTAPPQQQLTPGDHHYFEWSTSKQQTNLLHPLMTHTNRKQYYQHYEDKHNLEDNQLKSNKTTGTSPSSLSPPLNQISGHIRKKQKVNGIGSSSSLNTTDEPNQSQQTCYPFQAELTQKIDIECGSSGNTGTGQTVHTHPTHHFTLSTVINVSVNGQTQKSLDILPSSSQQQQPQYPIKTTDQQDLHIHSSLIPYSELNLSLYLKDIDLTTFDMFILPSCPNPQDYLTVDGLLTFLMSDKNLSNEFNKYNQLRQTSQQYPIQQMYNYPRIQQQQQQYRHPYPQYQMPQSYNYPQQHSNSSMIMTDSCTSSTTIETGTSSYYRQSSLPQQMTRYYPTIAPTTSFR
ncbi:unnamed protein product [Adineta steineri]|uniref:Uncharacterized protein n=1 Tax=Adineta steineri TaxID=433720 RepID=A0A813UDB4_9BILA|nr:unnamed protein product [Adineta steineri]CAF1324077.1 unnamed protein product [Adineta steineri]CAF3551928.1 unnamed protein product [Adineta steineri]